MTTLSFDAGYAMFQSDSALFGRPAGISALTCQLGRIASSRQAQAAADRAGRIVLALGAVLGLGLDVRDPLR